MVRTPTAFLQGLHPRETYYRGKRVSSLTDHPILKIGATHAAKLFEYPNRIIQDGRIGKMSRYFKIPSSAVDLFDRHELVYQTTMYCNGVFNISQAIGSDALFALLIVSKKVDSELGTDYHSRVEKFYEHVARKDLTLSVAQTDVKGDRSKRPAEQRDKDSYLRVVNRSPEGITVTGAKAHTTQSVFSDEMIVLPTRAMTEGEKDYSLSFSLPLNAKGLKLIARPVDEVENNTSNILSRQDYEIETLTVFDEVFVPWDHVFLCGESSYAGMLANLFATFHRFTAISYRAATANLYLGIASLISKANGVEKAQHIRNEICEIIAYKEIMRMSAMASAKLHLVDEGVAIPNPLYTNVGKLYSNSFFVNIIRSVVDAAGGIIGTLPSVEDFRNHSERKYITKYLEGAIDGESRFELLRLAKELASSSLTGYLLTLMTHAEGSMEASKLGLLREYDFGEAENLIKGLLKEEKHHS